jgi:hypothetical protein
VHDIHRTNRLFLIRLLWCWQPSGILRRVVSKKLTDVSKVLTAPFIRKMTRRHNAGGSKHVRNIRNISQLLIHDTVQYPRSLYASYSSPRESIISCRLFSSSTIYRQLYTANVMSLCLNNNHVMKTGSGGIFPKICGLTSVLDGGD